MAEILSTLSAEADLDGDDELVFAASADPAPEAAPRKGSRRGKGESAKAAPTPSVSVAAPVSEAAQRVAEEEPAAARAPIPPASVPAGSAWRDRALLAITLAALTTSLVSVGGMLMIGRTLAHAEADRAQVRTELAALRQAPAAVAAIDAASQRLAQTAAHMPSPTGAPATLADVHHEIDALKMSLDRHEPDGMGSIASAQRDGFSDLGTRIDQLNGKVEALGAELNASRRASNAAGRARPS